MQIIHGLIYFSKIFLYFVFSKSVNILQFKYATEFVVIMRAVTNDSLLSLLINSGT